MNNFNFKSALIVSCTLLFALVAVLWSWNILSELFGGPHAQFKHVVAAMSFLFLAKWLVSSKWNHNHGNNSKDSAPHNIS